MENTGRISRLLTPTARRILFGDAADAGIYAEMEFISQVDRAHIVMLAERGIIDRHRVKRLLKEIEGLRASKFAPLRGKPAPRGVYLLYESYLMEKLGPETGGILQTARSRNDLNATTLRVRLRIPYLRLLNEALRLQAILMRRSRRFSDVVMPAYTHYQAAVPITYGHYLAGVAMALGRDVSGVFEAGRDIDRSPLGAGAVGGTSLPIDPSRTATLLGFETASLHSIDGVASRDLVLRLLAAAAILGITLSRLSADLLLWSTAEFGFLSFPDELVGCSSMMPQKRNPFLLEHVQGRSASALGAFAAAATAMHAKPFTNSIAVGTEAVAHIWKSLQNITESITLTRLVVAGATIQKEAMLRMAVRGYTAATELANRLVTDAGVSFRVAHHTVGSFIREAIEAGDESIEDAAIRLGAKQTLPISLERLDPASVAEAAVHGGGPGTSSLNQCLRVLHTEWAERLQRKRDQARKWRAADASLDTAVRQVCMSADSK